MNRSGTAEDSQDAHIRKVAVASSIGTTIEWYDYFICASVAALVFGAGGAKGAKVRTG